MVNIDMHKKQAKLFISKKQNLIMETCGLCSKKIKDSLEMSYCSYCNMTFHFTCIEEEPCPNCDKILNIAHVRLGKPAEIFRKEKDVFIEEVDIDQKEESISPVEESFEKQGIAEDGIPREIKEESYQESSTSIQEIPNHDVPPMTPLIERGKTLRRREMPKEKMGMSSKKMIFIIIVVTLLIINIFLIVYVLNDGNLPFIQRSNEIIETTSNIFLNI